ncbi:nickel/cobalt transporter [Citreimonas sp.]|uniref:nickel/cobalt transporter n=1 Tax=Citreimonas sp. TaxID=3036715 RepID=UPI004058C74F
MRLILIALAVLLGAAALALLVDTSAVGRWAVEQQRAFQNVIAGALRALRSGAPEAMATLLGASAAYGFVHAVGPGHGKYLVGGVGLGTTVPALRLVVLALAASLAQALWAILLVYGGFFALEISAQQLTTLAEDILAPASYVAIAAIGAVLVLRGARALMRGAAPSHADAADHDHHDCGHAHGPSVEQVRQATGPREAAALVAGIAIRPCTGAVFLLVIAWQMEIRTAGAAAVVAMGLGTALLTSLVAVSSVAARRITVASSGTPASVALAASSLQVLAGALIVWFGIVLLSASLA